MACCVVDAKPLSEPMCNIVNWTPRNKLQWTFNRNSNIVIQENTFESVICELTAMLPQPHCVNVPLVIRQHMVVVAISLQIILTKWNMEWWSTNWNHLTTDMPFYQYREYHCGEKEFLWLSYLQNCISYTGKMTSLYWIRDQVLFKFTDACYFNYCTCQWVCKHSMYLSFWFSTDWSYTYD